MPWSVLPALLPPSLNLAAIEAESPPSPPAPFPWAVLVALLVLCLAMVAVMVRFSALAVEPRRPPGEEPIRPRTLPPLQAWGLLYLLVWAALIVAFLRFFAAVGEPVTDRTLGILLLSALGWFGFNAGWIALVRSLLRANARSAGLPDPFAEGPAVVPPATGPGSWEEASQEAAEAASDAEAEDAESEMPEDGASSGRPDLPIALK
jgi:hypothetical protein